ncbi:hypothetical protein BDP27DRAFT_1418220 [Rhodocollybia butyracea]|uniref:Uncharacterized protein n=1 Tax=Rhodocollybia butyracea TaxID=206335 RepID=A0A9P5PTX9_9AGAR|nr:hypothetical protein BDP27DRAFT_1418220 [Rhodocollybia butyracea]
MSDGHGSDVTVSFLMLTAMSFASFALLDSDSALEAHKILAFSPTHLIIPWRRHTTLAPFPGAWINLRLPRNTSAPAWKPWLGGPAIDLNFVVTAPNTVVPVGGIVIPPSNVVSDGMVVAHGWALPYGYDCTVTRTGWAGPPPGLKAFRYTDATPAADADVGESPEIIGNTLEISGLKMEGWRTLPFLTSPLFLCFISGFLVRIDVSGSISVLRSSLHPSNSLGAAKSHIGA